MRRKPVLKVATWIHIALRILLLLSGVTLLVFAVYMAVRWGPIRSQKIYPAVLAAASLSIITDIIALILLISKLDYIPTVSFFEAVTLGVGIWGVCSMVFSDYHYSNGPEDRPTGWQHMDGITFGFSICLVCERAISLTAFVIDVFGQNGDNGILSMHLGS
ncbi:predicted protein [Aspergillus terreus NIH2624]|uniref:MARVEL domain-containing protein n=1 Tax=Aspergillus terreus (strain NIH 2624 / FGSC A1156) TaxID=341663 RepID=Q0CUB1_ASPTN|nr:uncharacterized protein ATEG_02723 [Aspergillus terreus NIH2624]EAU37685.1 predicted protein [Aspergillus terreus NIH2624]